MGKKIIILICGIFFFISLFSYLSAASGKGGHMELKSSAFGNGDMIPVKYTCDGEDISPPVSWKAIPAATKSLAIICDDPDAPVGTWVHWVCYDILPDVNQLAEKIAPTENMAIGGKQGINDFRKIGYNGPCPPGGTHRYYFKLYALDTVLNLAPGARKKELLDAMQGHIIDKAQLVGRYKRQ